jgi:hypothetical protein
MGQVFKTMRRGVRSPCFGQPRQLQIIEKVDAAFSAVRARNTVKFLAYFVFPKVILDKS